MKRRGVASPDISDALACMFAILCGPSGIRSAMNGCATPECSQPGGYRRLGITLKVGRGCEMMMPLNG